MGPSTNPFEKPDAWEQTLALMDLQNAEENAARLAESVSRQTIFTVPEARRIVDIAIRADVHPVALGLACSRDGGIGHAHAYTQLAQR